MSALPTTTRITRDTQFITDAGYPARVEAWRGEGSYARVYRGDYRGRPCALKLAKGEIADAAARLRRERDILLRLDHPRIVALLDTGRCDDTPFLVLEWLEGETLLDHLKSRRRLPLRRALEILEDVVSALAHMHGWGLFHGDVSPRNVLLVSRGAVLSDPGGGGSGPQGDEGGGDVRAAGHLFHWMLTGDPPQADGSRLTAEAGYNRGAVRLWERIEAAVPVRAEDLLAEVQQLRRSL